MVKSRPKVIICGAVSIDGKIATKRGDSRLSSQQDLNRLHELRSHVDAVLIGTNTLYKDDPLLTVRRVRGKNPTRVILDPKGKISSKSKILTTCKNIPTIIAISNSISQKNLQRLKKYPIELITFQNDNINLKKLLKILWEQNIETLLVEGGGTLNWTFVKQNLFDHLIVTITPRIIGGKDSISLVEGLGFSLIDHSTVLHLDKIQKKGNEVILHYSKSK